MNKSIIHDITFAPWTVRTDKQSRLVKVENKDRVIFDGFHGEIANAIVASFSPEMFVALRMIADPWEVKKGLLLNDDASVIFEMAGIARKVLQKIEDEYSKNSNTENVGQDNQLIPTD